MRQISLTDYFCKGLSKVVSTHSRLKAAVAENLVIETEEVVSTHSRPKAAGGPMAMLSRLMRVSTHSRPKAAGARIKSARSCRFVSTHSRPKAAGSATAFAFWPHVMFQHTAARRRLEMRLIGLLFEKRFQHTAARRRLDESYEDAFNSAIVSTHSRPKAAGFLLEFGLLIDHCFNTQPPEGGWFSFGIWTSYRSLFQHTAARRRLESGCVFLKGQ